MKDTSIPKDMTDLSFERLTLVMGNRAGKSFAPINPEATIIGVKGAENEGGFLARVKAAVNKALGKKADTEIEDLIQGAVDWAKRDAMYDLLWQFYYALGSVIDVPMIDADVKREAIDALCQEFGLRIAGFAGTLLAEKAAAFAEAEKSGARHNKQDLEDIKTAHSQVGKALDALKTAHEATGRLAPADDDANKGVPGGSGVAAPANTDEVENMKPEELTAAIAAGVKAEVEKLKAELKPAEAPAPAAATEGAKAISKEDVEAAVKAAVEAVKADVTAIFQAQLDASKQQTADAVKAANDAKTALDAAVNGARERQAPGGHTDAADTSNKGATKSASETLRDAQKDGRVNSIEDAVSLLTKPTPKAAA